MLLHLIKRRFFQWLYHSLAFAYDLVAAAVSLGQWNDWGSQALAFVQGERLLELGHGPGYLLRSLRARGYRAVGLDESRQMGRLARRRLQKHGYLETSQVRSLVQRMPFSRASFDTLFSIFPSEYIFDQETLAEARRVLAPSGRLVVLPAGWPANPVLNWLFRITGESPSSALDTFEPKIKRPFLEAGFDVGIHLLHVQSGTLLIVIATPR
jgi:ubiquinone/menaquinone biosynthesis C-methylase UbiE